MTKKRRSRGRSKGGSGRKGLVQCSNCGKQVPRDKAKRVSKWVTLVDPQMARELRQQGAILPHEKVMKFYCISCAVHTGQAKVRARDERKMTIRL
ncbi:MAG: 30S ribosomal protein S26e [Candidatus Atabeyarchaeum deiterrae]